MQLKAVVNCKAVTEDRIIDDAVIIIDGDRILKFGNREQIFIPESAELIDAEGYYAGPGFIDTHCHGGGGYYVDENPDTVASVHLKHGTTGMLATTAFTEKERVFESLNTLLEGFKGTYGSLFLGIHMEGPYTNPKYGSMVSSIRLPDPEEYNRILSLAADKIKVWTLAPELEGSDDFIEAVSKKGIILSVGHSEASAERIHSLVPKGLRLACHCMDATGITPSPARHRGTREVGVDEAVMVCDDIYTEVIPDSLGLHVRPLMLRLLIKAKGVDRVVIITDAIELAGTMDQKHFAVDGRETSRNYTDVHFDDNGELSGSKLTMDCAVRNMMKHTGIGLIEAFKMASLNAATLLGLQHDIGSIGEGKKANIVIVTENMEVKKVIFEGGLI